MRGAARDGCLAFAIVVSAALPVEAQDAADTAWDTGDTDTAARLYAERLLPDSTDRTALHRLALIRAWNERYAESLVLFDRLLALDPSNADAAVDRARALAWRGDIAMAIRALDRLLDERPTHLPALRARAQFAAWAGELDVALAAYDRLGEIIPHDRSVRYDRARALSWASKFDEAVAVYDSLLETDPQDRDARLGLARVLSWSDRLDSAIAVYRALQLEDPADLEARRGLARTLSWKGDLVAAEREWRAALDVDARDVESLVGLGQTLRWQGRDAAALEVLRRAEALHPTDNEVRTQLRWVRRGTAPRVAASYVYESDSDGNRIQSLVSRAAWRPVPPLELRVEGYVRNLEQDGAGVSLAGDTRGGLVELWVQLEPGWTVSAGAGLSEGDTPGAGAVGRFIGQLASPGRHPVGATLAYERRALDVTALLAARGVAFDEVRLEARASVARWTLFGGVGHAWFDGTESNRRVAGSAGLSRRVARDWTLGAFGRAFGFEKDLADGYFDPSFYGLLEATARWSRELGRWVMLVEGAPGVQVLSGADPSAAARARAQVSYRVAPGREVSVSGLLSRTGVQVFSSNVGSYRYGSLSVSGSWAF